ncbi:MAG: cobaltochelatase subunit CobN [Gammaproteobacteria bacterium]|nr:cobaltochelatase subunit CobN [Gammaproteobacteria bacterium]
MKVVYISVQSSDAHNMVGAVREISLEKKWDVELYCVNGEDADDDPMIYQELVRKSKVADLVLMRCMAEPSRMKRFARLESVLAGCPGYVMIYAGNVEVRLMYRDLFKGSDEDFKLLVEYIGNRGGENDKGIIQWLHNRLTGGGAFPEPIKSREDGAYHPDCPRDVGLKEYLERLVPGWPTVGILYTSNLWIYDNQKHIDMLIRKLESIDVNVIPVFFSTRVSRSQGIDGTLSVVKKYLMDGKRCRADAIIMATPFSQLNNSRDCSGVYTPDEQNFYHYLTDVPVIQAMTVGGRFSDYEESASGLSNGELKMSVVWPEVDGQIITVPIGSNEGGLGGAKRYSPIEDRIEHLSNVAKCWAKLSMKPASERKVAILMYQSRPESGRIGNAAGLDTIESVNDMLLRFDREGYTMDHVPLNGRALIDEILDNITNDLEWSSPERVKEKAADMADLKEYGRYYSKLSDFNRRLMEENWGEPPGTVCVENGEFVIPGLLNGNIFIGYQPLRSWADRMESVYHDPVVPMPHQYLMFYRWLKFDFGTDIVFHMGTHGTLEWLPGKSVGLSSKCFPDIVLDGIPHIYPYIIDDPGEGIQCKRRSEAVLIGHMCPAMARAGSYDELSTIDNALQEFFKARNSGGEKRKALVERVLNGVREAKMFGDLGISEDISAEEFEDRLDDLHSYLTDIKDALIRDGLHILGRAPEGDRLDETIYSIMRLRNGDVPSLRDSFAEVRGYSMDHLLGSPSEVREGELNSVIADSLEKELLGLLAAMRSAEYEKYGCLKLAEEAAGGMSPDLGSSIGYICDSLSVNIVRMTDEMDNLIHGCNGGYVLPGPSGAPTRGNAHILPMGRNYYGIDPDIVPPPSSWEIGKKMADQMVERYVDEIGHYPREVGFIIWATDTMKTNGDDVAYILWLMGIRPVWSKVGGQVVGLEPVPLSELGRPRIDVTVRITGLFRDTFPNLIDLIDDAVKIAAGLDESEEENYLAANLRKDIVEGIEKGLPAEQARKEGLMRIFGCPPGGYGPGVNHAVETGDWKTVQDLADIYIAWGSYAYGRGVTGESMKDQFVKRFSKVGVTVKNMPDREIDVLDMDDVYSYLGGLNSFVRAYGKKDAISLIGDGSNPDKVRLRSAREELQFVFRSKVLNPKFIEGLKRHGYRGVAEVANLTEYTFGWDATSETVDDWMYEKLAEKYLFEDDTREWMKDENPHAMMDMMNRLMEACDRGMWDADPKTLEKMKEIFLDLEERIEEVNDR